MTIVRGTLSVVAAIFTALLVSGWITLSPGISNSKATGVAVVFAAMLESLFTPIFWVLAVLLFTIFFLASRLSSKPVRVLLFWMPTATISALGMTFLALIAYLWLHFRKA